MSPMPMCALRRRRPHSSPLNNHQLTTVGSLASALSRGYLLKLTPPCPSATATQLAKLSSATGHTTEEIAARSWRRLVPQRVHMSDAVRGVEAWVAASEYTEAAANPLAPAAVKLLKKMNGAHSESLKRFAAVYAGIDPLKVRGAAGVAVRARARGIDSVTCLPHAHTRPF